MRATSRSTTFDSAEVTVLALLETVVAIGLTLFALLRIPSFLPTFAIMVGFAPLLLLRTEQSVDLSLRIWDRLFPYYADLVGYHSESDQQRDAEATQYYDTTRRLLASERFDPPVGFGSGGTLFLFGDLFSFFIGLFHTLIAIPLLALISRSVATLVYLVCQPLTTIRAIPANWFRLAACTDILTPLDVLPGSAAGKHKFPIEWSYCYADNVPPHVESMRRLSPFGTAFGGVVWLLPSFWYRISLKATTLIYSPLVYVARPVQASNVPMISEFESFRRSDLTRIASVYSLLVVILFLVKVITFSDREVIAVRLSSIPGSDAIMPLIQPQAIPIWQLAAFLNATLMLLLWVGVGETLVRHPAGSPLPESNVAATYRVAVMTRRILTVYVLLCTIAIVLQSGFTLPHFVIDTRIFP